MEYFECITPQETLKKFSEKNEEQAVGEIHFSTGMSIRNNWKLWAGTSKIAKYFMDLGIHHPDDMSGIILTSLHRKLNQKEIELDKQIKYYQDFWAKSLKQQNERKEIEFSKFKVGDTVEFQYNYDFTSKNQEKGFMDNECLARGVIKVINPEKFELKVKLLESCGIKGIIIMESDVYTEINGEWKKTEENKIEIMKKGETRWTYYDLWEIVE
ncbi:hypothetical protein FGG15_17390 [Flagellimonas algicola]|uniref:DUF6794 domain-containing protein n=2 Tax=Flagellimonas algicola TaxID=2583815 RepID=A0ABY2WI95_9FLAO|nr:hypothetical protein FGG15_17390 [Allomuricauda algicola]